MSKQFWIAWSMTSLPPWINLGKVGHFQILMKMQTYLVGDEFSSADQDIREGEIILGKETGQF